MVSPIPRPVLAQAVIVLAAIVVFTSLLTIVASVPTSRVPEHPLAPRNATVTPVPGMDDSLVVTATPEPWPDDSLIATSTPVPDVKDMIAEPDMEVLSLPANLYGSGSKATGPFHLDSGAVAFDIRNDAPGNIEIWLMYDGERLYRLLEDGVMADGPVVEPIYAGGTYNLAVTADGDWQINIRQAERG